MLFGDENDYLIIGVLGFGFILFIVLALIIENKPIDYEKYNKKSNTQGGTNHSISSTNKKHDDTMNTILITTTVESSNDDTSNNDYSQSYTNDSSSSYDSGSYDSNY